MGPTLGYVEPRGYLGTRAFNKGGRGCGDLPHVNGKPRGWQAAGLPPAGFAFVRLRNSGAAGVTTVTDAYVHVHICKFMHTYINMYVGRSVSR